MLFRESCRRSRLRPVQKVAAEGSGDSMLIKIIPFACFAHFAAAVVLRRRHGCLV